MPINQLSTSNTFQEWLIVTNQLANQQSFFESSISALTVGTKLANTVIVTPSVANDSFFLVMANTVTGNATNLYATPSISYNPYTGLLKLISTEYDGSEKIVLPRGNTAQRLTANISGSIRYNTQSNTFEGYTTSWNDIILRNDLGQAAFFNFGFVANTVSEGNHSHTLATPSKEGMVKLVTTTKQSVANNTVTATANRTYAVQFDGSDYLVVNVPWTSTSYGAGGGLSLSGTTFNVGAGSYIKVATDSVAVDATSSNTVSKVVARDAFGNFSAGTITASLNGNANTATKLATVRTINGVNFDGSSNIDIVDSTKLSLTGGTLSGNLTIQNSTSERTLSLGSSGGYWYGNPTNSGFYKSGGAHVYIVASTGNVYVSGAITANGDVTAFSDIKLKDNIKVIDNSIDKIKQIRGVTFTRKDKLDKQKRYTGIIAQEVEKILPEVVSETEGIKTVAYGNMIGLLIEGIKEQQIIIEEQSSRLNKLEKLVFGNI